MIYWSKQLSLNCLKSLWPSDQLLCDGQPERNADFVVNTLFWNQLHIWISSFHFRFVLFQVFVTPSSSSFKHNLKDHKDDVNILNNSIIAAMTTGFCLLPIFLQIFIGLHERGFHGVIHLGFFVCILPLKIFNYMCSSVQVCACLMLTNLIIQLFTILFKWLYSKKKFIYREWIIFFQSF